MQAMIHVPTCFNTERTLKLSGSIWSDSCYRMFGIMILVYAIKCNSSVTALLICGDPQRGPCRGVSYWYFCIICSALMTVRLMCCDVMQTGYMSFPVHLIIKCIKTTLFTHLSTQLSWQMIQEINCKVIEMDQTKHCDRICWITNTIFHNFFNFTLKWLYSLILVWNSWLVAITSFTTQHDTTSGLWNCLVNLLLKGFVFFNHDSLCNIGIHSVQNHITIK